MAYSLTSSSAASSPDANNGHFCYADKFAILTNGLGIVREIVFLDDDLKAAYPELPVEKKSDSPEEEKTISNSAPQKLILSNFFAAHPDFHPDTFLGDAAFDSADIYGSLKNKVGFNVYNYPPCPNNPSLSMKCCSIVAF